MVERNRAQLAFKGSLKYDEAVVDVTKKGHWKVAPSALKQISFSVINNHLLVVRGAVLALNHQKQSFCWA